LLAPAVSAGDLSPQEERGKQIYLAGTSPREEPLAAYAGEDSTCLPGFAATCASCRGHDGHGRPEADTVCRSRLDPPDPPPAWRHSANGPQVSGLRSH